MMKLISRQDAYKYLAIATVLREKQGFDRVKREYILRLGQALWNSLPDEITKKFLGTEYDFFGWTDNAKVIETFYSEFVED